MFGLGTKGLGSVLDILGLEVVVGALLNLVRRNCGHQVHICGLKVMGRGIHLQLIVCFCSGHNCNGLATYLMEPWVA